MEVMAFPKNKEELAKIFKASALMDLKPAILGAGTNILAPDEGLCGLVIENFFCKKHPHRSCSGGAPICSLDQPMVSRRI